MTEDEYKVKSVIQGLEHLLIAVDKFTTDKDKVRILINNIETTLDFLNDKEDRRNR